MMNLSHFYYKKNILVTGGAGFIGSHLVNKLVEQGAHVTIIDNFSTGRLSNLYSSLSRVSIIYGDIRNKLAVKKACANASIIFHCAAYTSAAKSVQEEQVCLAINSLGTKNILEAACSSKTKTLVFSSSAAVYGDQQGTASEESPLNPLSPYAQSKIDGEILCTKASELYDLQTFCLRYFNVYGDRQKSTGGYAAVVPVFTKSLIEKKPIIVYGDGMQTRDFISVAEVVQANMLIGALGKLANKNHDTFNIATGKSITLLQLIDNLSKKLEIPPTEIIKKEERPGDIKYSWASSKKYLSLKKRFLI